MFNTLRYAKELENVGLSRAQAEKHMEIIVELLDTKLATKDDIARLEKATKDDIARLEKATKDDIKVVRGDIARLEKTTEHNIAQLEKTTKADLLELKDKLTVRIGGITAFALTLCMAIFTAIFKFL